MKRKITITLVVLVTFIQSISAADFFSSANQFFSKYVKSGQVNYSAVKSNGTDLNNLIDQIASYDLKSANDNTKKAFMINAYNILAIKGIVKKYPVKGPMNINKFFDSKVYIVAGQKMSLNSLEKEKLYPFAKDPRLHFVLVCAAVSCPKLASFAYTPDKLEKQLESQTKAALNDTQFIKRSGNTLLISQIFNWYKADFKKKSKSVLAYINGYLNEKVPANTKVSFYTYIWDLNDNK